MNMKYAMRSEDTEQINVVSWANWNVNRYPELRWLFHVPNGGSSGDYSQEVERIEPHVTTATGRNAGFQVSRIANEIVLHDLYITG